MISKTSGLVSMYGMNLDTQLPEIRKSLGLCTQKDCLYDELTVWNQRQGKKEIMEIFEKTELVGEQNKQIKELSGGSKRKLSLAMSLVGDSKIIFLDQPTSGLDAYSRRSIWKILEKIREDRRTIILITHHLDEAEVQANRISIMSKGQLLEVGSSEFIKKKFGEGYNLKISFDDVNLKNQISDLVMLETQHCNENKLVFNIPFSSKSKLFYDLEKYQVKIGLEMKTLEDAFVKIGLEDEKIHLNYVRRSEIQTIKKSMGLIDQIEEGENLLEKCNCNNNFPVNEEIVNIDIKEDNIPEYLKNNLVYSLSSQFLTIFLRQYYTVIRTSTNYFSIIIPMMTFIIGLSTVAGINFDSLIEKVFTTKAHSASLFIQCYCLYFSTCT